MFELGAIKAYELIDAGNGEKLERFGDYILIRPEITALWPSKLGRNEWKKRAHAIFKQTSRVGGHWDKLKTMPDTWKVTFDCGKPLTFELRLTKFKHVGIFPEQLVNWKFIHDQCEARPGAQVLNLFAYTGGATLAAKSAGADATHVDSIRQVVSWSNENMVHSGLKDVRWLVEDALKFARRAEKRGTLYDGLIMDPPAWGLGPKGEKWKLEEMVNELFQIGGKIVRDNGFLVVNTYSGIEPSTLKNLITTHFSLPSVESNELILCSSFGHRLGTGSLVQAH
ncbi:MAG: 23S rRNA (cytosine1962-C5)-methyltransferase [Flavobacteriales bacterium]|jgi:23S rRNA (cytosine1962-C5)-methyltransferase